MNDVQPKPHRLIRLPEVLYRTGMSRSALYNRVAQGVFPAQIKINRTTVWLESDVDAWIEALLARRGDPGKKAS
ncbi:MAG TPA: AlpA family phage regulatory protein [Rhodocyclaceae bacterium]|nr:AlpA family phage regulatory protein [Rhodocyclaceae bacterium]